MTYRVPGPVVTPCTCLFCMAASMPAEASEQLKGGYGFDVGVNAATDGNLTLTFLGDELKGRWSVKGDQLCVTLIEGQESETACSVVHYDGSKYYSAVGISFYAGE